MTVRAEVLFRDEERMSRASSFTTSSGLPLTNILKTRSTTLIKKANRRIKFLGSSNPGDTFGLVGAAIYDRFKKEDVIDHRMQKEFMEGIWRAPPLTSSERALVKRAMEYFVEMSAKMKRIPGTLNETVEKLISVSQGGEVRWGMTKAKIDVAAKILFAELWVLSSYQKKRQHKKQNGNLPRVVWENLDGSRSLQLTTSVKFPAGFDHRFFNSWITWEAKICGDGRKEYIIAFAPMNEYEGTHHRFEGTEKMTEGWSKGVHIVREVRGRASREALR